MKNMNMRTNTLAPTTIPDLQSSSVHIQMTPDQNSSKLEGGPALPYPFMSSFVDRKMGNRFSKRVNFDRSDYDDMLGQIIDQIHEKRDKELLERI